jgi:hypothetical protein
MIVTGDGINLAYRRNRHEKHFMLLLSSMSWIATPRVGTLLPINDAYVDSNKRERRADDIEQLAMSLASSSSSVTLLIENAREAVDMADQLDLYFYLGDPSTDRSYSNGNGFKRRATIAAYRHNARVNTQVPWHLQLLVNDITARVLPLQRLHEPLFVDMALYDVPASRGYECNLCHDVPVCDEILGCDYRNVDCEPLVERCSRQQGCITGQFVTTIITH